jgi:hypothetical protein
MPEKLNTDGKEDFVAPDESKRINDSEKAENMARASHDDRSFAAEARARVSKLDARLQTELKKEAKGQKADESTADLADEVIGWEAAAKSRDEEADAKEAWAGVVHDIKKGQDNG